MSGSEGGRSTPPLLGASSPSGSTGTASTTTGSKWLQGRAPNVTARDTNLTDSFFAGIKKKDRKTIKVSDLDKLKERCEKSIEHKFCLMDKAKIEDLDSLKEVYKICIRTEEFSREVRAGDMSGVFTIPSAFEGDSITGYNPSASAREVCLFNHFRQVELDTVRKYSTWIYKYGDESDVQDLFWSAGKVLNSCELSLREKINESAQYYPLHEKTGPVYFKLMMHFVLSSTPVSIRAMTRRLEKLKLGEFAGENVVTAVSLIRGAVAMMSNNKSLPSDIESIVFRIMKTSSTKEFNIFASTMESTYELGLQNQTLEDMLLTLQKKYKDLVDDESWTVTTTDETSFNASDGCWNCGAEDHRAFECPEDLIYDNDGKSWRDRRYSNRGGRGRGRGGQGRGRYRGRGGRGRERDNDDNRKPNVFRTPPQSGTSHVRKRGNVQEKWCGVCGVWGSHLSKDHDSESVLTCTEIKEDKDQDDGESSKTSETPFAGMIRDF